MPEFYLELSADEQIKILKAATGVLGEMNLSLKKTYGFAGHCRHCFPCQMLTQGLSRAEHLYLRFTAS